MHYLPTSPRKGRQGREKRCFNVGGRERARRADETAEQRETRLGSRRVRDNTARRAAQTAERRESDLQLRRDRVSRQSILRKGRPDYIRGVSDWPPSLLRKGRPGYSRGVSDWPPSLLRKGRPGYSRGVSYWPPRQAQSKGVLCSQQHGPRPHTTSAIQVGSCTRTYCMY